MIARVLLCLLAAACTRSVRNGSSSAPFTEYILETAPGLSGVCADPAGFAWAVPERVRRLFRIDLGNRRAHVEGMPIVGVPEDLELEDITILDREHFVFGAEGGMTSSAAVLMATMEEGQIHVTDVIDIPESELGLSLQRNRGAEGVCHIDGTLFVAIESDARDAGRRWSPLVRIDHGRITSVQRIWLTTRTGHISALDCRHRDGVIEGVAVERNFGETKVLTFTIPERGDIEPVVISDLGATLQNRLNLEGIMWFRGALAAVNDNQWRGITGPSELIVFPRL